MQLSESGMALLNKMEKKLPPVMPKKSKLLLIDKICMHGAYIAMERGDTSIGEDDLLIAMHQVLAPRLVNLICLRLRMGRDKKAEYQQRAFDRGYVSLDTFWADLAVIAEKCGGHLQEDKLRPVLECYREIVERDSVYTKTTDRDMVPKELFVRAGHTEKWYDLAAMAKACGLMDVYDNRVYKAYTAICAAIPVMGSMVDISAQGDIQKFYAFLTHKTQPLGKLRRCPDLPASLLKNAPLLESWGLKRFGIFGVDLRKQSLNFYYYTSQTKFDQACAKAMLTTLGFPLPSEEILEEIGGSIMIYFTFSYASDRIERICFTRVYEDSLEEAVALAPSLKDYIEDAPIRVKKRNILLAFTFHSGGVYVKSELDYKASLGIPKAMRYSGLYASTDQF